MQELAAEAVLCRLVIHYQLIKVGEPSVASLTVGLQERHGREGGEGRGGRGGWGREI